MSTEPFRIELAPSDEEVRVGLVGEIDLAAEEDVVSTVGAALSGSRPTQLVLDLRAITFMDSSGLRALLRCRRIADDAGVRFRIAVAEGPVTRLFSVAGVSDWFECD